MVEKSKKKHKKSKTNEVSDTGMCETELGGNDIGIEGCKHSDKEDVNERKNDEGREKEKKKQKKKKVREDSYDGVVEKKKVNEKREVRELSGGGHQAGNVNENHEKKKKKRDKDKIVAGSCYKQVADFEAAEGNGQLDVSKICGNVNQHDKEVETVERISEENPLGKVEKKKRKRKKDRCVLDEGASQQDSTQLIESGKKDMKNQNGEEVREDSYDGVVEKKKVNEKREVRELSGGGHQAGNVNENHEKKKKKREKDKIVAGSCHKQVADFEAAEGNGQLDVSKICGNVNQHDKEVETVERISEENPVGKVGKKKRKRKKDRCVLDEGASQQDSTQLIENGKKDMKNQNGEDLEEFNEGYMTNFINKAEKKKKKKKKREKGKEMDSLATSKEGILAKENNQRRADSTMNEEQDNNEGDGNTKGKGKKSKSIENGSQDSKSKKSPKKVRFSANVEVFPPSKVVGNGTGENKDTMVRGKRFSKEEDEIVKQAVFNYIEENCLGDEGLNMVLNSRSHPKVRCCWKEIGTAIPYRPYTAVYYRAQVLFRRSKDRKWTEEECKMLCEYVKEHGAKWRALADEMGKHRFHVKDAWRRLKFANLKRGHWDQEEYQTLFKLVNMDLVMRLSEEKKSKYGMLRDNISWTAISEKLSTRSDATCCVKWYKQLTSPMVAEGKWADADDYRLINALYQLDASCIDDVNWDNLLDHRSGDVCWKRWKQMVLHIGQHGTKSFAEQVEVLANRYCPDLLDARVAWDDKLVVD